MADGLREKLRSLKTFPSLVKLLRDELDWPITTDDFDEATFDYTPDELGLDPGTAAKIQEIKRLRPLTANQPWGVFFVKFEPKRLPVVALRRILNRLVVKKRASANSAERRAWEMDDLMFISSFGESDERQISFAHFAPDDDKSALPALKVLGWDNLDTALHLDHVAEMLETRLVWPDDDKDSDSWREAWRSAFTLRHREVVTTSQSLAIRLAELARAIRDRILTILEVETDTGAVTRIMAAFREALIHDLSAADFADMYAQTVAYGLLSARITNPEAGAGSGIDLELPVTNPFLKDLMEEFLHVGGRRAAGGGVGIDFDELGIGEVIGLLDEADMQMVVRDFGDRNPDEDPVIHFYELFLKEYDAEKRVQRGVFYTPRPVVSYIVRSVHELLRTEFGLDDGLADTTTWDEISKRDPDIKIPEGVPPELAFVQVLDPATGTGTFLVEVIDVIYERLNAKWKALGHNEDRIEQLWKEYVPEHLLTRLHGYELLMAPYAIAHLKIGLKLYETGYRFDSEERARIYLTNSLEPPADLSGRLAGIVPALAREALAVNSVKADQTFTVVIGNPPYARASSNRGPFAEDLVEPYKEPVKSERNIQPLSDDYLKFIGLSQRTLARAGVGIHGMVTNNTYLSGRVTLGVRKVLIDAYATLEVTDLHGSGKVKLLGERGAQDENVFDILQGVGIGVFVMREGDKSARYCELIGVRQQKYAGLLAGSQNLSHQTIEPKPPYFLLVPSEPVGEEYEAFHSLEDLFSFKNVSGKPGDDSLLISFSKDEVVPNLERFRAEVARGSGEKKLTEAGTKLARRPAALGFQNSNIVPYAYRPFDTRYTYYDKTIWTRAVGNLQESLEGSPVLLTTKIVKDPEFTHVFVSRLFADVIFLSNTSSVNTYSLPSKVASLAGQLAVADGSENLETARLVGDIDAELSVEDVFGYIYAILHSPIYRNSYFESLKYDFPRIPAISDSELFRSLSERGNDLISLHLLESPFVDFETSLIGDIPMTVEAVSYSDEKVWLDKARSQGFGGVPDEAWQFRVGSYQVCHKWLKDRQARGGKRPRRGRVLNGEDVAHYQMIVAAVGETIRIMGEIDEVIEDRGGWPDAFTA